MPDTPARAKRAENRNWLILINTMPVRLCLACALLSLLCGVEAGNCGEGNTLQWVIAPATTGWPVVVCSQERLCSLRNTTGDGLDVPLEPHKTSV